MNNKLDVPLQHRHLADARSYKNQRVGSLQQQRPFPSASLRCAQFFWLGPLAPDDSRPVG